MRGDDLSRPLEADGVGAVAGSAMIRVRTITATMHPPSPESPYGHAEATAVVLEAVGMNELLRLPAREGPIFEDWKFYGRHVEFVRDGNVLFTSYDAEGDLGTFAIWHETDGGTASLLVAGGWGHHENFVLAGRRILNAEEVAMLRGDACAGA